MNTIILPRAIALQCQLNDTLYDLQHVGNTLLNDASASSPAIVFISHNVVLCTGSTNTYAAWS